jgi:hypothetical protein
MKRALWITGGALIVLLVAALVAWTQRRALAEWYAVRALASRGIAATLQVSELDARGARIAPFRLEQPGLPALDVIEVELAWKLGDLLGGRVQRVVVQSATVKGRIELPDLAGGAETPDAVPAFVLPVLPMDELELRDVTVDVDTAQGHFALQGEGRARFAPDQLAGAFRLAGDTPYGIAALELSLEGTPDAPAARFDLTTEARTEKLKLEALRVQGRLHTDEAGTPRWQANGTLPFFDLPELARLEEIALDAEGDARVLKGKLRIARAIDVRKPPLWAPLKVELDFEGPFDALAFTGRAQTQDGAVHAELRGTLEPPAQRADVTFRIPETDLGDKQRQPGRISPRMAAVVQQARGHLGAKGSARFENGVLRYQADVALREIDARAGAATLRGVTGAVRFEGPPLATPPGQLLSIAAIEEPLPLANGLVEFQLTKEGAVSLASAVFSTAKGTLSASGLFPLDAEERSLELVAKDLDVTSLLAALPFDALSGTGTLAGSLPLKQNGARVRIENGTLRATTPGVIRYRPVAGSEAVAEQKSQLGTVFGALEDLHYDSLELDVSGDTAEELDLAVRIAGNNPNFQNGRAVRLNVNVEARLGDLVKAGQAAYRVPGEVEERVRRILDREKR